MRKKADSIKRSGLWPVLVLSCGFFVGGFVGCLLGKATHGAAAEQIGTYLNDFISLVCSASFNWSASEVFWLRGRWLLLGVLMGLTRLSGILMPGLFALRGIMFGFCVACFVRFLPGSGLLSAGILFGIPLFLCLPGFFYMGWLGFLAALRSVRMKAGDFSLGPGSRRRFCFGLVWSAVLLLLCVCYECTLMPALLRVVLRISL